MPGLLVNGEEHPVPGLHIINSKDADWCRLGPGDCRARSTSWVRQIILHTTKGDWPQRVIPGRGPGGKAKDTADMWRRESTHAGAHLVIDNDGTVACLCDLAKIAAYHAELSNDWSIGIEMYQEAADSSGPFRGVFGVYEAVYDAAVKLVPALCRIFGIQLQVPKGPYKNEPLRRLIDGGPHCVGVFGHRDNTPKRGQGCPGDEIFARLVAIGAEEFDHDREADLAAWRTRQETLNRSDAGLLVDGIPGSNTVAALKVAGCPDGIWAFRKHERTAGV